MAKKEEIWDVAVIGGGPAGMMAAGTAAAQGARVVLIEKNKSLGKKLLITGGGRCNVTNAEFNTRVLLSKFKDSGKFLFSPFAKWSVQETLDFFHARNMPTKIEAEQRVFPATNSARSVYDALVGYMREGTVRLMLGSPVERIHAAHNSLTSVQLKSGTVIAAKSFILATGGTSHPETGSTGDGFKWLEHLGIRIHTARAALVPVSLKDPWIKRIAGVSLKDVKITVFQNNAKQASARGKVLFTHTGLSGPGILNLSHEIGELLKYDKVFVEIDLYDLGYEKINATLQELFKLHSNKKIKNSLGKLLPSALVPIILELSQIDPDIFCNSVTRPARIRLLHTIKHFRMEVHGLLGMDKAIIASGGVVLEEIDTKSMRLRSFSNLYVIGDLLDIRRPSGGYSLQLCWTTGRVAGDAAARTASTS
jgi:predicted Rossmann fold flavoprotein